MVSTAAAAASSNSKGSPKRSPPTKKGSPKKAPTPPSSRKKKIGKFPGKKGKMPMGVTIRGLMGNLMVVEVSDGVANSAYLRHLQEAWEAGYDDTIAEMGLYGVFPKRVSLRQNSVAANSSNGYWRLLCVFVLDEETDNPEKREWIVDKVIQVSHI